MPNVDLDSGGTYYSGTIGDDTDGIYFVSNSSTLVINSDWDINGLHVGKDSGGNYEIGTLEVRAGFSIVFTDNSSAVFKVWNQGIVQEGTGYETTYDSIFTIKSASGYDPGNRFPFHVACAGSSFTLNWYEIQGNRPTMTGQSNSEKYHIDLDHLVRRADRGEHNIFSVVQRKGTTSRTKWEGQNPKKMKIAGRFRLSDDVVAIRQVRLLLDDQKVINFVDDLDVITDVRIVDFSTSGSSRHPFQKSFQITLEEKVT